MPIRAMYKNQPIKPTFEKGKNQPPVPMWEETKAKAQPPIPMY